MRFDDTNLPVFHFTGRVYSVYNGRNGITGVVRANNDFITYSWTALVPGYTPEVMDVVKIQAVEYYPNRFIIIALEKESMT